MEKPALMKEFRTSVPASSFQVRCRFGQVISVQWTTLDGSTYELRGAPMLRWLKDLSPLFETLLMVPESSRQISFQFEKSDGETSEAS